jgi:predicted  nucleic acid-binding Zn-ribbon protein
MSYDQQLADSLKEIERLRAKTKADAEAWHEQEEKIERLRAAVEQALDDMADSHCVCEATKQMLKDALTAAK